MWVPIIPGVKSKLRACGRDPRETPFLGDSGHTICVRKWLHPMWTAGAFYFSWLGTRQRLPSHPMVSDVSLGLFMGSSQTESHLVMS